MGHHLQLGSGLEYNLALGRSQDVDNNQTPTDDAFRAAEEGVFPEDCRGRKGGLALPAVKRSGIMVWVQGMLDQYSAVGATLEYNTVYTSTGTTNPEGFSQLGCNGPGKIFSVVFVSVGF